MEIEHALEREESQQIPLDLVSLLSVVVEGFQTHLPDIEKLLRDLDRLGRVQ